MNEYTLTLVTLVPFTQVVTVQAEDSDAAIFAFGDKVDPNAWVRDDTHVIGFDDIDVEHISPDDDEDYDDEEEDTVPIA